MPEKNNPPFKVIPLWKFIFLSIITFRLYELYWFYKQWQFFQEKEKSPIYPFWRAVFSLFFVYSLFKRIGESTKKGGYKESFSPGWSAFFWILLSLFWQASDSYWLISLFSSLTMLGPLRAMNYHWGKKQSSVSVNSFTGWEIVVVLCGFLIWVLLFVLWVFMAIGSALVHN